MGLCLDVKFDTQHSGSPGKGDNRARELELPYVYLGYWVPESRKMAYKARFRPSEILQAGQWRRLGDVATEFSATVSEPAG